MTSPPFGPGRSVGRIHSATDLVSSGSFASPLAQLSLNGGSSFAASRSGNEGNSVPPVPPLNLNLFRTPSIYSVDSIDSLSTISNDELAFNTDPESPSTPRAAPQASGGDYFSSKQQQEQQRTDGPLTPKRSFVVTSRQPQPSPPHRPYASRSPAKPPVQLHRDVPEPQHREEAIRPDDLESVYGEQGSDWGEDEQNFEWLDSNDAPQAVNGDGRVGLSLSPSKRIGVKLKATVSSGGDGKKLRKPLVLPRRAAPPPPRDTAPAPPPSANANSPLFSGEAPSSARSDITFPTSRGRPTQQQRWQDGSAGPSDLHYQPSQQHHQHSQRPTTQTSHVPTIVPVRSGDGPSSSMADRPGTKSSHASMQSAAYSFYDLDSPGPSSPAIPMQSSQLAENSFTKGRYTRVPVSRLDSSRSESRERTISDPTRSPDLDMLNPDILVAKGIEARGLGDLPKSAWLFMKAAAAGSSTGRMYWGLALRHGWGVAKDDKKAFAELRQACDESLAEGGIDFHRSPGTVKLSLQQRKAMTRDLSLGMFEIANCFLEGVGAKKAPDVALSYLRFAGNLGDIAAQEQLGFLLSKGGSGIKKDMKEAAKWYRMAISQGSSNTFGLAWVWKDKYM